MTTDPYVQAAYSLWASKRYKDISVRELVKKAGTSTNNLYHTHQNKRNLFICVLGKIQKELIALSVSAAQGQSLHDRLYQAMLAIVRAFDTSQLYRNAYADYPVIATDTDKDCKNWGQVLSEICNAVGLENPVPMVVFEYYFGVLEILRGSKEKFGSAEKRKRLRTLWKPCSIISLNTWKSIDMYFWSR